MKLPAVLRITVTPEDIELATRGNPGGCVFANAISRTYPWLATVLVTDDKISFSDRGERIRYHWFTPPEITEYLQDWDSGKDPVPPTLTLPLKHAWVNPIKEPTVKERAARRAYNAKLKQRLATESRAEAVARQKNSQERQRHIRRSGA